MNAYLKTAGYLGLVLIGSKVSGFTKKQTALRAGTVLAVCAFEEYVRREEEKRVHRFASSLLSPRP